MRAVVQRVGPARVEVEGITRGEISSGLLVYLGVGKEDTANACRYVAEKLVNLRIFPDENGRMNRSLLEAGGEILVISQFTLYADTRKGRRPSYNRAALSDSAELLYRQFLTDLASLGAAVASGVFQAEMQVFSLNLGPVTILLDSEKEF
jgi:D-aminoacyl-tRNA deacylase